MPVRESAAHFLSSLGGSYTDAGQFNVYKVDDFCDSIPPSRRDFYKISFVLKGEGKLSFGDRVVRIKDQHLFFTNPQIPYSWERLSDSVTGYFCIFYDLLRSYVQIILHEALKMSPASGGNKPGTSAARISDLFQELLDRQFPIISPQHTLQLKNANEFADSLSLHINHLNRSLKEATGRTTTELITERLIREAKALLLHSSWDIARIGFCLGFAHASNFNTFFKKHTGQTPNHFRQASVNPPILSADQE